MGGRSSKTSGNQSLEHVTEALAHVGLESSKKPLRLDKEVLVPLYCKHIVRDLDALSPVTHHRKFKLFDILWTRNFSSLLVNTITNIGHQTNTLELLHSLLDDLIRQQTPIASPLELLNYTDTKSRSSTTCIVVICHEGVLMVLKEEQRLPDKFAMVKDADHSVTNAGGYLKEYVNGLLERKLSVPFFRLILCARRGGLYEIGYFNSNTRKTSLLQDIGDSIVIGSGMHWADFYLYGGVKSSQFHPEVNDSEIRSQVHQLQLQLSKSGVAKVDYGRFETNLGSQRVQLAKLSENPKSKATLGKNSAIIDEIRVTKERNSPTPLSYAEALKNSLENTIGVKEEEDEINVLDKKQLDNTNAEKQNTANIDNQKEHVLPETPQRNADANTVIATEEESDWFKVQSRNNSKKLSMQQGGDNTSQILQDEDTEHITPNSAMSPSESSQSGSNSHMWKKDTYGNIHIGVETARKDLEQVQEEIAVIPIIDDDIMRRENDKRKILNKLLLQQEEMDMKQKSRSSHKFWYKEASHTYIRDWGLNPIIKQPRQIEWIHWKQDIKQMIVLNVDGCCSQDRKALGGIFRLPNGIPIVAFNRPVLEDVGIGCVETKAICEGFKVADRLGFKSLCVQADSEFAVKVINGDYKQPWSCITDLRNVKNVISRMDVV
ncbi:hypothetical protein GIB67_014668 [Kingdonia uniflora]|uniref:RNase H type-1 domain-containing protein n=1 Tax=Kingdonia uniflora TaxID=39325 RepID=A0A7J7N2H1_9MAGN|nr:hypothetical protein GIB67_014668 [Kingdonia uniflora]